MFFSLLLPFLCTFFLVLCLLYFKIVMIMTPPCLNSWSGSDSQSSTPLYWSSATSSASTFDIIYHLHFFLTHPLSHFLCCPFLLSCLFCGFVSTSHSHRYFAALSPFCSLPSSPNVLPWGTASPSFVSLSLSPNLSVCLSPCTWLCPITVLAKQTADEIVFNSVICQHIQPRKLHCSCVFSVCECACAATRVYSMCDYAYVDFVLRCILLYPSFCMIKSVYRCIQSNTNSL